ncbi:MAG TPA: ABC transporter permease, partial [Gemmatirosa sp.]
MLTASRLAWRMVVRRPARSTLAALGIALVVAGLVVAEAVAGQARRAAAGEIRRIGADVLTVTPAPPTPRGGRARAAEVTTLRDRDARELAAVDGVLRVAGEYRGTLPVKAGALARQASVAGVDVTYGVLRDAPLAAGRFFDSADAAAARRVAVLGARLAADLAGGADAVATQVRLRGIPFDVVGVLAPRGTGLDAFDEDETVFVPLTTARQRLFDARFLQRLFVRADARAGERPERLATVARDIGAALAPRHHTTRGAGPTPADRADVVVATQDRLVETRRRTMRALAVFQAAVGVVLVAAGAGGVFGLQLLAV